MNWENKEHRKTLLTYVEEFIGFREGQDRDLIRSFGNSIDDKTEKIKPDVIFY